MVETLYIVLAVQTSQRSASITEYYYDSIQLIHVYHLGSLHYFNKNSNLLQENLPNVLNMNFSSGSGKLFQVNSVQVVNFLPEEAK